MIIENYILVSLLLIAAFHIMLEILHIIVIKNRKTEVKDKLDFWKLGIFYFNPNDKRIFVPKKIEWLGWTLNFAQPFSIIIISGIVILIVMTLLFASTTKF